MAESKNDGRPPNPVPTDGDIDLAVERLNANWTQTSQRPRNSSGGHVVQTLARGRAHVVTVEVKRPPGRPRGSR